MALPGSDGLESPPDPHIDIALFTGLTDARNAVNVRSAEAVIANGGGRGTLSEIAPALRNGRPVIAFRTWAVAREGRTFRTCIQWRRWSNWTPFRTSST